MALAINLRGDLAKLSDAELEQRLQTAIVDHEETERKPKRFTLRYSRRGPIRHPLAYRLLSIGGIRGSGLTGYLGFGLFLKFDAVAQHLALCEPKDVMDELKRRVESRKVSLQ